MKTLYPIACLLLSMIFTSALIADDLEVVITQIEPDVTNGAIDLTISGGIAPFQIMWTGPGGFNSTNEDLIGLPAGIYTLNVTDAYCGTASIEVLIDTAETVNGIDLYAIEDINIYPNPFSNMILLEMQSSMQFEGTVQLFNIDGKEIFIQPVSIFNGKNEIRINSLDHINSGLYTLAISGPEGYAVRKILIKE
ncbi:MAG: hypothetical protein ACI959_002154 [Limisphaerales bacterium]|jgi:hypothetical protein